MRGSSRVADAKHPLKRPGANDWVVHAASEYSARFVDLVNDDDKKNFYFVESCCFNKHFDPPR